jgi:hypothetical protein
MSKIVQEKYQVNYDQQDNDDAFGEGHRGQGWITDLEARAKKCMPGREGRPGGDSDSRPMNNAVMFHSLPPGMDIEDQEVCDIRKMGISLNGNMPEDGATGDVTNMEVTASSLRKGFHRKKMLSTDDAYTREHNDAFYDVVEVEGDAGFVERNNYLDRV